LVCATNFVGDIDSAVLRPGRFDLVIPIGPPDLSARRSLWEAALAHLDQRGADIEKLATKTNGYTPGDIELAAQRAAAVAFDRIREGAEPAYISSEDLEAAVARTKASVSTDICERFAEEVERFARI
jgi:SpoVK/Ycf46/Vps4 family AAA+-type ATPase